MNSSITRDFLRVYLLKPSYWNIIRLEYLFSSEMITHYDLVFPIKQKLLVKVDVHLPAPQVPYAPHMF